MLAESKGNRRQRLLQAGRATLEREAAAISALQGQLGETFADAVEVVLSCAGHVIVSGAGTSAAVAQRLAHLLTCAGAPALYLSAGESAHGGAAAVTASDVLIALSKGGETEELNNLARVARERGATVVALTGSATCTLARQSQVVVQFTVDDGVEGHGVIAFGSSLAASAVGDALCCAVLEVRGYSDAEFVQVHPGGAVGKMLRTKQPRGASPP